MKTKSKYRLLLADETNRKNEFIILIHGLFRSAWSMYLLARYLRKQGYDIYLYDYPSTRQGLAEHITDFQQFIYHCIGSHPKQNFNLITHSMGGIIARGAIAHLPQTTAQQIRNIIMLAPPNQGSPYAAKVLTWLPSLHHWVKPLYDISNHRDAHIHQIGSLYHTRIGILAARFDKKAPIACAVLPNQHDFMVINTTHTLIIDHPKTKKAILSFLQTGNFRVETP